jgi:uncharacterized protein YjbI with pentapeptide repeats
MIEGNRGPEGLDLSELDLSSIDLGYQAINQELERRDITYRDNTPWYSAETKGINLRGVDLTGANLRGATLHQADLRSAILRSARLQDADFKRANLQNADLWEAKLQGARFFFADMRRAILWDANLENADLAEANLTGVNLFGARLLNTYLTRKQLGEKLDQDIATYQDPVPKRMPSGWGRHRQAQAIYLALKNNFYSLGLYEDGSWAYTKERQSRRATYHPRRAGWYYGDELRAVVHGESTGEATEERQTRKATPSSWHWWWFHARYTWKWLLDWAAELSCGYGERPLRTVVWAGAILLVFPFLYAWSGGIQSTTGPLSWLGYFNYSLGAFTTIGFAQFEATTSLAQTLTSLQALLGISILALLMFALGNRISRS